MSFLLTCPNCGKRPTGEFTFRGEFKRRPSPDDSFEKWIDYVYMAANEEGKQLEWWFHRSGCGKWFLVKRNTTNNTDHESLWFHNLPIKEKPTGTQNIKPTVEMTDA